MFKPTIWDLPDLLRLDRACSSSLFLLFLRFLPMISMSEMRGLLPGAHGHEEGR